MRTMATLKSRIDQLEFEQWLKNMAELDRYLEGRSEADNEFFCVHGYLPDPPLPGPPVHIQSRRSNGSLKASVSGHFS